MFTSNYELTKKGGNAFKEILERDYYVHLPNFFEPATFSMLRQEIERLLEKKHRKDFLMEDTDNTPRHISTVGGVMVTENSTLIPALYENAALMDFLEGVAGQPIYTVRDKNEHHVINCLHKVGDTHGGHVDSYAYAFNIFFDAPDVDGGGELVYVPNSTKISDLDTDKAIFAHNNVGDAYFFRTDLCAHRVNPLTKDGRRTILNLVYAEETTKDLMSYSSSKLYS
jgi:hypothetical protein